MHVIHFLRQIAALTFGLLLLGSSFGALAQGYLSEQERFVVDQIKGCAPLKVNVIQENRPSGSTNTPIYKYNYDGDLSTVTVNTDQKSEQDTTYEDPGTYRILQVIGSILDTITVEVMEPRPPQFRVFNCINNNIYLEINDNYYDRFSIDFGDGATTEVATSQPFILHQYDPLGEYTITVQGLFDNADSQNCSVADTTITTINDLTVADITSVAVESNRAVRVKYQLPNPDVSYRLEIGEAGSNNFGFAGYNLDNDTELLIDDLDIDLRRQSYCFRIVAVNRCDENLNLPSETLCSIALQADAKNRQNQLTWTAEGFTEYRVLRGGNPITTTSDTEYRDTNVRCQLSYSYQVRAESAAGVSTSEQIPLTAQSDALPRALDRVKIEIPGKLINLLWSTAGTVVQYYVYRGVDGQAPVLYDSVRQNPIPYDSISLPNPPFLNPFYRDTEVAIDVEYCYQLTYRDACGNESARSEPVCALLPSQGEVHFPNAFTPNGDGLNDVFVYTSLLIKEVDMEVYDRWGEIIFQTNQLDVGWDGSYQGAPAPQGTYLYKIAVTDQFDQQFTRQGSFVLLGQ